MKIRINMLFNVIILIGLLLFSFFYRDGNITDLIQCASILTYISIALSIWYFYFLKTNHVSGNDFRLYYIIFNMIFTLGQIWLVFFGKEDYISWKIMFRADVNYIFKGGLLALCMNQAMIIGLFLPKRKHNDLHNKKDDITSNNLFKAGIIVFFSLFPLKIYYDYLYIRVSLLTGSYVASDGVSINGMVYCLGVTSIAGIFYIIVSKKLKLKHLILCLSFLMFYFAFTMLNTGDRRFATIAILCIVLCVIKTYNIRFKVVSTVIGLVVIYLSFIALNIISSTRATEIPGGMDFLTILFINAFKFDVLWETFSEFGITLFTYSYTLQLFPSNFSFRWGNQILVNIVAILPVGGFINQWKTDTGIQTVVNDYISKPLGGSLGADLYGNFSWFGILGAVICGYIISKIMRTEKRNFTKFEIAKYYSLFYIFINLVRVGFSEILRLGFYTYFVPIVVCLVISGRTLSGSKRG